MPRIALVFVLLLALSACQPLQPSEQGAAQALGDFFTLLHEGQYPQADALYGGSYDDLVAWNPDVDPANHAVLWARACTRNGLQCLAPASIDFGGHRDGADHFRVTFLAPDGSLFVLGPCCGATEQEMPSTSAFEYRVAVVNGQYRVLDLPVYVP